MKQNLIFVVYEVMAKFKTGILEPNSKGEQWLNLSNRLGRNDYSFTLSTIISELDISGIESKYSKIGQHAYPPRVLLGIIFLGYSLGDRSGGVLSDRCRIDIRYIHMSGGLTPCKSTINKFRADHHGEFYGLFVQFLKLLEAKNALDVDTVYGDGTILKANASKKRTKDLPRFKKWLAFLEQDIKELESQEVLAQEEEVKLAKKKTLRERLRGQ